MTPQLPSRPGRSRQGWRRLCRAVGGMLAPVLVMLALVEVGLDAAPVRGLVTREVNRALEGRFKGEMRIVRIATLHWNRAAGVDARVEAPDGTVLVDVRGASARITPFALLSSLLGHGDLRIDVLDAEARWVDVDLCRGTDGRPLLATALEPRSPSRGPPGRGVRLVIPALHVVRSRVHPRLGAMPRALAELDELRGSVRVAPGRTEVDVARVTVVGRGVSRGADPHGVLVANLLVPSRAGSAFALSASFRGDVGGVLARATCAVDAEAIDASLDVRDARPEVVRAMIERWPLQRAVSLHAEARGPWSAVRGTATAAVGAGRVDLAGELSLQGPPTATLTLDARDIDLAVLGEGTPVSDLGLHATAKMTDRPAGAPRGSFWVRTEPGSIEGQPVPPATIAADFDQPGGRALRIVAHGTIDEPGAPVSFDVAATTAGPHPRVTFEATSHVPRLESVDLLRRAMTGIAGAADLRASGALTLRPRLDLNLALHADIDHLAVGRCRFPHGHVDARGSAVRQDVDLDLLGDPAVRARATVLLGPAVVIDDARVTVDRPPQELDARIDRVRIRGARVDVEGAHITGAGAPLDATMHLAPGSFAANAASGGLDLQTLGHVLGIDQALRRGRAAFHVRVEARRDGADGRAVVTLDDGCLLGVDGLTGHLDASMAGRVLAGTLDVHAADLGSVTIAGMHVELGGPGPLDLRAWRRMWGRLRFAGDVDLGRVAERLPANTLPVGEISGRLRIEGHLGRGSESDAVPDVALSVRTSGLRLAARSAPDRRRDGTVIVARPRWKLEGVDASLDASVVGGGLTELALRVGAAGGALVALDAKSDAVPFARLLGPTEGLRDVLERTPFTATVTIPQRSLQSLPDAFRPGAVLGTGDATMTFEGSLARPTVALRAEARAVRLLGAQRRAPLDAALAATYDGQTARAVVEVRSGAGTLAHGDAELHARAADILSGAGAWDASVRAHLDGLPVEAIPLLTDRDLRGEVTGDVTLERRHAGARASADLDFADLRLGRTPYGRARVDAGFDGRRAVAHVDLDEGDGRARLDAWAGLAWGARVTPTFDARQPAGAILRATNLRIGIVTPFVQRAVGDLDGRLDADVRVALAPGQPAMVSGAASLRDGQVAIAPIGQQLHAVRGEVSFEPGGVVRLSDASAEGASGKMGASGLAHLAGARLVDASAEVTIAKQEAMPVAVEGTEVGTVYGKADLQASFPYAGPARLHVDVPSWHVDLPEASTHAVEELGVAPEGIHVGTFIGPGRFVEVAVDGAHAPESAPSATGSTGPALITRVKLGDDVQVRRGTELRVDLGGDVTATTGKKTTLTGQVRLRGGVLDVQGKSFEIESGTLTFVGDPSNPTVKVTAGWVAADGTRVFADYTGPLKTGKVTLRSEPPRPRNEILALILFGTADGSASTPYSTPQADTATRAGTTVGAFASGGLSKGIDKLTGMDITAKVDASQANPRPELDVQIARGVSLQLAFVLGTPPPGTNPDTTYATLDWRFHRNWSLKTTFGNLGSSIADLVWQKRY